MMCTGKIGRQGFMDIFSKINEKLYKDDLVWFKEQLTLGKINKEKYEEEINNISKFHARGLRSFFISTISSHCGNLKIVASMEGQKYPVDTDSSYTKFDRRVVLNHYFPLLPYLSFEKTVVNQIDDKGHKQIKELKKQTKEQQERINKLEAKEEKKRKTDVIVDNMTDEQLDKMLEFLEK